MNTVRPYAWGSRDFIAALQGRPAPAAAPEAELWLGAHPAAPSRLVDPFGPSRKLDQCIADEGVATLGSRVAERFSGELPFLMKVLAAAHPLSLQAHPDSAQAQSGFAAEEAAGIPLTAAERSYKDRRHKPELIVALTPFAALYGFRPVAGTKRLLRELAVSEMRPYQALLDASPAPQALRLVFERLLTLEGPERLRTIEATLRAISEAHPTGFGAELAWSLRLADLYPGDIGVIAALFLNLVDLSPYQALYLPAGNLHAYLEGAGVEIMASSDNVIRGGLTPKAIDVRELLRIVSFNEVQPQPIQAISVGGDEFVFATPAQEFELSFLRLNEDPEPGATRGGQQLARVPSGPEILLVTGGQVTIRWGGTEALLLSRGESAFIPASSPPYLLGGAGTMFRAKVPQMPQPA